MTGVGLFDRFKAKKPESSTTAKSAAPTIDFSALRPELKGFIKPTWKPVVAEGEGAAGDSRFGGAPGVVGGESWPVCGACGTPLTFFLQMNLGACPGAFGTGLLQLFYCLGENCDFSFAPGSKNQVVRIVDPAAVARPASVPHQEHFPARRVTGWKELRELPNWEELSDLGVELTKAEEKTLESVPYAGDKLGGWPAWVQGVEYPTCPKCSQTMRLVFQLDSDDNVPYMWGDVGCGHITQCPDHRDVLAYGWACC